MWLDWSIGINERCLHRLSKFVAFSLLALLGACGGGGGGGSPAAPACTSFTDSFGNAVTCAQMDALAVFDSNGNYGNDTGDAGADGTAGDGAPIVNAKLRFVDINNNSVETTTDATGYFRVNLRGLKAPIVATVLRDNLPWKSMLVEQIVIGTRKFYTINLTALTDKISSDVAKAAGLSGPAQLTPTAVQANLAQVQVAKDALNAQLTEKLVEAGLNPSTFNALTQPFKPDLTGYDKVLENVVVVQNPGGTTELQPKHSIGGSFSGSGDRAGLELKNGTDSLKIASNSAPSFAMPIQVLPGTAYKLEIARQPSGSTCNFVDPNSASGIMGTANITTIGITCSGLTYSLGGTVAGLGTASGLVLASNGQTKSVPANRSDFAFDTRLPEGTGYEVTVQTQPTGATCSVVSGGKGVMPAANLTSVAINCNASSARLGGSISGLTASGLRIDAAGQSVSVAAGAPSFAFDNPVAFGTAYTTTIQSQPAGQTCTFKNGSGSGIMGAVDINSIEINCTVNPATLGGEVKNLIGSGLVLSSNGQSKPVAPSQQSNTPMPNVSFAFTTPLAGGTVYSVRVQTQPSGQTCTVGNGNGTMNGINVSDVLVTCSSVVTYTVGGTANNNSGSVTIQTGSQTVVVPVNPNPLCDFPGVCDWSPSPFTFRTPFASGSAYNVVVVSKPANQTCTVRNGSGVVVSTNVSNVEINCSDLYTIGGNYSGGASETLTLVLNEQRMTFTSTSGDGDLFTFPTRLSSGASYSVTVLTPPPGKSCTVTNGTGTVGSLNVSNVHISCFSG